MDKQITFDNIRSYTYINNQVLQGSVRGIVIHFTGLGGMRMFDEDTDIGRYYGEMGILYLFPYVNPWCWMNPQTVAFADEIIDAVLSHYGLPDSTPIVSVGESMGGQSGLVYTAYAKRTPVACVVDCPVCDLPYHFTERPDLPRTLYSAFFYEKGSPEEVLKAASPTHMVDRLPDVKYVIYHCEEDTLVNIHSHTEVFLEKMRAAGKDITFIPVPGHDHCDLPEDVRADFEKTAAEAILK